MKANEVTQVHLPAVPFRINQQLNALSRFNNMVVYIDVLINMVMFALIDHYESFESQIMAHM